MKISKIETIRFKVKFLMTIFTLISGLIFFIANAMAGTVPQSGQAITNGPVSIEKGRQYINEGFHEKAIAVFKAFIEQNPNSEDVATALIEISRCQKEIYEKNKLLMIDNLIKSYEELATRYPQSEFTAQAYYQIGQTYEKELKEYKEAIKYYEKCTNEFPMTNYAASSYYRIGQINENNLNDYDSAVIAYEKLARDFYKFQIAVDARLRIQQIYETKVKDPRKSMAAFNELISNYPENKKMPEILINYAKYYEENNDTDNAIKTYQQVIDKYPKDKNAKKAFEEIAAIYEKNRDYKNLAQTYIKMYEFDPTDQKADHTLFQIAQIYEINLREYKKKRIDDKTFFKLDKANLEESIKYYTKLVDTFPQSSYAPTSLMKIANILNNDLYRGTEAKEMYQAIVEKYQDSKEYQTASTLYNQMR
ncbi:MAG: tetratricopeptide repeat protein [Candidatus Wallbacteria bacterium]